jgi:HSP20 family protein
MALVKFNQPAFPSFFNDEFFKPFNQVARNTWNTLPAVNVKETEAGFQLEVAAPGLKKEDFKINLNENRLVISAQQETQNEETNEKYARKEFSYTSFQRAFVLPKSVDGEKIEASYADGILHVTLPKKEEAKVKAAREIAVA